ncbi:MAG: hypothetical protein KDA37_17115, partial [Planctomycetales bacterium]|nr:hypothetical protein [Planctomycetales bacterium]
MLNLMFLICAAAGGTILLVQLGLMMLGMGDDVDGGFDGDADFDVDADLDADLDADADHHTSVADAADADLDHPDAAWLFQVISIKGVIAAITFFGLGGLWARSMEMAAGPALALGAVLGGAA